MTVRRTEQDSVAIELHYHLPGPSVRWNKNRSP
jgi:hypothetical protein